MLTQVNASSAKTHLKKIIWISITSLIIAYLAGMIHFGVVYLDDLSDSTAVRIESQIHEQVSEIVTEVLLDQRPAVNLRLDAIQRRLNHDPFIRDLCIQLLAPDLSTFYKSCESHSNWNRQIKIPISAGSHKIGLIEVNYALTGVFQKIFSTIAPVFIIVIALAIYIIFAIFKSAERVIIGPFADAVRSSEQQAATHKTVRMLAHDVRRPFSMLSIMLGEMTQATSFEEISERSHRYHSIVQSALYQITQQMDDVLNPSKQPLTNTPTHIADLIKSTIQSVHFIFQKHTAPQLNIQSTSMAACEPHHIRRVFENVLANAFEAAGPKGLISILITEAGDQLITTISNDGPQIPETDLTLLFSDTYTKGKTGGNGLGLAIAKRYVEESQGSISCRNIVGGVEFTIVLPKIASTDLYSKPVSVSGNPLQLTSLAQTDRRQPLRLLIVEDEIIYQDALLLCLERLNRIDARIIPMIAQSSEEALRFSLDWQPHAIICDQNLGASSLSGIELAQIIQAKSPEIPFLLLSNGILDTNTIYGSHAQPRITAVQKPIDLGTLELFLQTLRVSAKRSATY